MLRASAVTRKQKLCHFPLPPSASIACRIHGRFPKLYLNFILPFLSPYLLSRIPPSQSSYASLLCCPWKRSTLFSACLPSSNLWRERSVLHSIASLLSALDPPCLRFGGGKSPIKLFCLSASSWNFISPPLEEYTIMSLKF